MEIDNKTIDKIAELAKLEFNAEAKEQIKEDMNRMLKFVEKLNELDTESIEPLIYMTEETNNLREDELIVDITQDEALKNAPKRDSDYFKAPKVMEKK